MYIDCHTIGWKIRSQHLLMQSVVVTHSQPEKEEDVGFPIYWYTQSEISIFLLFFNELELDFDLE